MKSILSAFALILSIHANLPAVEQVLVPPAPIHCPDAPPPFKSVYKFKPGKPDHPPREILPYYLSIATIFRNEAPYLKEWIEYHLMMGVDHFYLYNNMSEDNYLEVLNPYIEHDIVTLVDWPNQEIGRAHV